VSVVAFVDLLMERAASERFTQPVLRSFDLASVRKRSFHDVH